MLRQSTRRTVSMFYDIFTGGFYQDEMGQDDCKRCSIGTFVSEQRSPGTTAADCVACPYILSKSENKDKFQKKRNTLPFLTLSSKISTTCINDELRLFFFYFTGNGILHVKSIWRYVTFKPIRCFRFLRQGVSRLKNRVVTRTGTSDELSHLIEESN